MVQTVRKKSSFSTIFLLFVVGVVLAGGLQSARSQSSDPEVWHFTWDAPTSGSAPVYYVVEIKIDGQVAEERRTDGPEAAIDITVNLGSDYEVRVAGVDVYGRQGPFSDWSYRDTAELSIPRR